MRINQEQVNWVVLVLWGVFATGVFMGAIRKARAIPVLKSALGVVGFTSVLISPVVAAQAQVSMDYVSDSDPWESTTSSLLRVEVDDQKLTPIESKGEIETKNNFNTEEELLGKEIYRVVKGDNLWDISKAKARKGESYLELWKSIISENSLSLKSGDPNLIYPGEEISISHLK